MKILVTGASGFLGRHFDAEIIRQDAGHEVWAVDLVPNPWLTTDVEDVVSWLDDFDQDVDLVIHLAAPVGGREKIDGDPMYNSGSLAIDQAVFRWAIKHAKTMLYPSSSAVYPVSFQTRQSQIGRLNEGMFSAENPNWFMPDQMYGFTKLVGEFLAWKSAAYGLNTLCIRPFSGYGPGQSFDYPVPSIARRVLAREDPLVIWGSGDQKRDFVHVEDLVLASFRRLKAGIKGYESMNIASGWGLSFIDIAMIMCGIVGYRPEIQTLGDKPEGVFRRVGDPGRMRSYYELDVKISDGLRTVLADVEARVADEEIV